LTLILLLMLVVPALAQMDAPAPDVGVSFSETRPRQYLFDWGGRRTPLEEKGIKFDFFYT
jgi:hypothetical protein